MAKRKNRLKPIDHEIKQLDMLRELEPNATPSEYRALSDQLIQLAQLALHEVHSLEDGNAPEAKRIQVLKRLIQELPS